MDLLGNTLEKVALEKAGIIKEKIPVIIGESDPATESVFYERARAMGAEIIFADKVFSCRPGRFNPSADSREFLLKSGIDGRIMKIHSPLAGNYQAKNIPVVVAASELLNEKGLFRVDEECIVKGIRDVVRNTGLAGRWHIIGHKPLIICDTGHNREGIEMVVRQLSEISAVKKHLILGFVNDKPLEGILPLFPPDAWYYFARSSVPRALDENVLRKKALAFGLKGEAFGTVGQALEAAKASAGENDLIFIGGSTFVVADIL